MTARKYNPDELYIKFQNYIDDCIENNKLANIDGFCIFANMDEQTYYNYKKQEQYFDSIKKIESLLLDETIQKGFNSKNPTFIIFYLKNKFGWVDKQEIKTDVNVNKITVTKPDFDEE